MCKVGKKITFCSCKNEPKETVHHKKSKRWKAKNPAPPTHYVWTLVQFAGHYEEIYMEGEIATPSSQLDECLTNEFVLEEINSRNCFDFAYIPKEGDSLGIRRSDRWTFLSYIFAEGTWEVGHYSAFYTRTEKIDSGEVKIEAEEDEP